MKKLITIFMLLGGLTMAFQGIGRLFYNYELSDHAVRIVILGMVPVKSIPFADIESMREVGWKETLKPDFTTLRLGNRLAGPILEITRKSGLFKRVLITPDEPKAFVKAWQKSRA